MSLGSSISCKARKFLRKRDKIREKKRIETLEREKKVSFSPNEKEREREERKRDLQIEKISKGCEAHLIPLPLSLYA